MVDEDVVLPLAQLFQLNLAQHFLPFSVPALVSDAGPALSSGVDFLPESLLPLALCQPVPEQEQGWEQVQMQVPWQIHCLQGLCFLQTVPVEQGLDVLFFCAGLLVFVLQVEYL